MGTASSLRIRRIGQALEGLSHRQSGFRPVILPAKAESEQQGGGFPVEATRLTVNGKAVEWRIDPSTPLLWALREHLGLTGTKLGCGMALCGACTVHVDGNAVRSGVTPVAAVANQQVTTLESLSQDHSHPVQRPGLQG